MREYKCLVDEATANEFFAMPSIEFDRHIRIRTIGRDGTLTMRILDNEQPKPLTKTEYVKCEDGIFDLKPDFEAGDLYYKFDHEEYYKIESSKLLASQYIRSNIYRKVEKEIDWREDLGEFLNNTKHFNGQHRIDAILVEPLDEGEKGEDLEFIAMCRLVESLTRHIEV